VPGCAPGEEAYTISIALSRSMHHDLRPRSSSSQGRSRRARTGDSRARAPPPTASKRYTSNALRRFFIGKATTTGLRRSCAAKRGYCQPSVRLKIRQFPAAADFLPQPPDLLDRRTAAAGLQHLPLSHQSRRFLRVGSSENRQSPGLFRTATARSYYQTKRAKRDSLALSAGLLGRRGLAARAR